MPGKKKASGKGAAYTTAKKYLLVTNIGIVLPILESGWDKVHGMHNKLYGAKNRTVESLRRCFTITHWTKAPSSDPIIAQKIREVKMTWLQIWAKSECSSRLSKESVSESKGKEDNVEDMLQELLVPHMV
eukprot:4279390-Ditylum_brightwellii.AAC.1